MQLENAEPGRRLNSLGDRKLLISGVVAACLVLSGFVAYLAQDVDHFPGEQPITLWVQSWQASWLDSIMQGISAPGYRLAAMPLVALTLAFLYLKGLRKEAVLILAATLVASAANSVVKEVVARPRPSADGIDVVGDLAGFSFPSGHVLHYVVFLGTLAVVLTWSMEPCIRRRLVYGSLGLVLAAVGVSRMYLGAHWLGDVLAGYALGAVLVLVVVWLWRLWADKGAEDSVRLGSVPAGAALPRSREVTARTRAGTVPP